MLSLTIGYGQSDIEPYLHWNTESGLPSNEIYDVIESSKGKIWIATDNGVVKYNGTSFQRFGIKEGLTDNVVFNLFEDEDGSIWCTTKNGEICKILPNDSITPYEWNDTISKYVPKHVSTSLLVISLAVSNDTLFLGYRSKGGIYIDPQGNATLLNQANNEYIVKKFGKYTIQYSTPGNEEIINLNGYKIGLHEIEGFKPNFIKYGFTLRRSNGNLVGTYANVAFIENNQGSYDTIVLPESIIYATETKDILWLGTWKDGAYGYHYKDDKWTLTYHLFKTMSISSITADSNGDYWFATHENGIYYSPDFTYESTTICSNYNSIYSVEFLEDFISTLDSEMRIKVIDKKDLHLVQDLKSPMTTSMVIHFDESFNSHSLALKASDTTLFIYNGVSPPAIKEVGGVIIFQSYLSEQRIIQVSTNEHISVIDLNTEDTLTAIGSFGTYKAYNIGHYVICTGSNGCSIYEIHEESIEFKGRFLLNENIRSVKSRSSDIFVSSKSGAIYKYNPKKNDFEPFYYIDGFNLVDFDISSNAIWLATSDGLLKVESNNINKYWEQPVKAVDVDDSNIMFATNTQIIKFKDFQRTDNSSLFISSMLMNGLPTTKKEFDTDENNLSFKIDVSSPIPQKQYNIQAVLIGQDTIRSILNGREISYAQLSPGDYQFYVLDLSNNKSSDIIYFSIRLPFWKEWWFITSSFSILILLGLLSILTYYKRREKKNELHNQLIELQSKALRAQMNPHFIFNVMNVIQSLISSKKLEESSTVLVQLSKLIRSALNYSKNETITLKEELEFCHKYFELENLRLNNRMNLYVNIAAEVKPNQIDIPPLTLQPIIENAIIHGIIPKKGNGQITIEINIINRILKITIADNGIGIANSSSHSKHKSHGLDMVSQRIAILDKRNTVEIEPNVKEGGTIVRIRIYL